MKSVLVIVPYDNVYPPVNGGMQRCFHLVHQLSKSCHLTLLVFQSKESFLRSAKEYPSISNITIYSTNNVKGARDIFNILPQKAQKALRYRWLKKRVSGSADGMFLEYYPLLKRILKRQKFDHIILENLLLLHAVSVIRRYDASATIIYDAHNVDSTLVEQAVKKQEATPGYLKKVQETEGSLYKNVHAILACSEKDRIHFSKVNDNKVTTVVIPNGVTIGPACNEGVRLEAPGNILFCGALWTGPNSEGVFWFYKHLWPRVKKVFPLLKLLVVGSGTLPEKYEELTKDGSLIFTGGVDDVKPWYNKASLAIVPLLSGSGTRLKILEAMSLGVPVISTSKGAEGIEYTNGLNIIIADEANIFAERIIDLLRDKELRLSLLENARKLVKESYDWNVIGTSLAQCINTMGSKKN